MATLTAYQGFMIIPSLDGSTYYCTRNNVVVMRGLDSISACKVCIDLVREREVTAHLTARSKDNGVQ